MDDRDVAASWNASARTWTQHVRAGYGFDRILMNNPAFSELIGDIAGMRVLDACCGEGYNTRLLARRAQSMTGIDISEALIAQAREEEAREPLGIRYELGSVSDMRVFGDHQFDALLSTLAMMDVADYRGAVTEVFRVLRPGGMFAFSTCHPCFNYELKTRKWVRDSEGRCTGIIVGNYFRRAAFECTWRFRHAPRDDGCEPMTTIGFDRTLSDYINPLCRTGFVIERIVEPQATHEACAADPSMRNHQLIPHTLLVKARKPKGR